MMDNDDATRSNDHVDRVGRGQHECRRGRGGELQEVGRKGRGGRNADGDVADEEEGVHASDMIGGFVRHCIEQETVGHGCIKYSLGRQLVPKVF